MNILEKIAEKTKQRIIDEQQVLSLEKLEEMVKTGRTPFDFRKAFVNQEINIISEIKFASPSEGYIAKAEPLKVAEAYLNNGAKALSVLTEPDYFKGDINYIAQIREKFPQANILMKDFVVDEYQLLKAKVYGADAVLLIVALLGKETKNFLAKAKELNLTALVEVHNEEEMKMALEANADFIGVNNRNLKDMTISLKTSEYLIKYKKPETIFISESGLKNKADLSNLQSLGYQGFLIGTSFMKSDDPGKALASLLS